MIDFTIERKLFMFSSYMRAILSRTCPFPNAQYAHRMIAIIPSVQDAAMQGVVCPSNRKSHMCLLDTGI